MLRRDAAAKLVTGADCVEISRRTWQIGQRRRAMDEGGRLSLWCGCSTGSRWIVTATSCGATANRWRWNRRSSISSSYLIADRDRIVTKAELLDNVWGDRFVSESALTTRNQGRSACRRDDGIAQKVVRTVHGRGYRLVADVEERPHGRGRIVSGDARQVVNFCHARDGVRLAYAVSGDGPPLLKAANWLSHLEYDWESSIWRHWWRSLSRSHRLDPLRRTRLRTLGLGRRGVLHGDPDRRPCDSRRRSRHR